MTDRQLIQERYAHDPWKLLVGCICCNLVQGRRADAVLEEIFSTWPTAKSMHSDWKQDSELVRRALELKLLPLGLQGRRSNYITMLTAAWVARGCRAELITVRTLPGCGKYAEESWRIFVDGERDFVPDDKELRAYLARERSTA